MRSYPSLFPMILIAHAMALPVSAQSLDETLFVGRFSQCSYNAISSILIYFYGATGETPDRKAFEDEVFYQPLKAAGYEPYYGWGPWTSYMVESGKMVWNHQAVTGLKAERFSLRPVADVQVSDRGYRVTYAAGERKRLREKLLGELAKGPVLLWTPYAASMGLSWRHVRRLDDATDLVPLARSTHSVALFQQPAGQVLVVDGSKEHGLYIVDPDVIVATSAAMTAAVRIEDQPGKSIYKNGLKGIERDEYNVTFIKAK